MLKTTPTERSIDNRIHFATSNLVNVRKCVPANRPEQQLIAQKLRRLKDLRVISVTHPWYCHEVCDEIDRLVALLVEMYLIGHPARDPGLADTSIEYTPQMSEPGDFRRTSLA